ncbi:MAG: glycosyltransferase family 9 protein [Geminicoccaceae bacterium]
MKILVIKQSALGDIILSTGAFAAIRDHHQDAEITLLTTKRFRPLVANAPWFDRIEIDSQPARWQLLSRSRLRRQLNKPGYHRVYDLQGSRRTNRYLGLFANPKPEWSGIAPGASHFDKNPDRTAVHTVERHRIQLSHAGVDMTKLLDIGFMDGDLSPFDLPRTFCLLVPGSAPRRPKKRWPAEAYGELAHALLTQGITPVLIGGPAEADAMTTITGIEPDARDLSGRTDFGQIAALARRAAFAVGNDTGPMHIIAAAGCPTLTLFSSDSTPVRSVPGGPAGRFIQVNELADLTIGRVLDETAGLA